MSVLQHRNIRHASASWTPRWMSARLGNTVFSKVRFALDAQWDMLVEAQIQGQLAALPGVGTPTALPFLGFTRGIARGFTETDASYANRLIQWLDLWRCAGRPVGLLLGVLACFLPSSVKVTVVDNTGNWYWYNAGDTTFPPGAQAPTTPHFLLNQGNWDWDGLTAPWWRVWVIIDASTLGWTIPHWGDGGKWGDPGRLWGIQGPSYSLLQAIRAAVKQWKAAHSWVVNIIISTNPARFDPTHGPGGGVNPDGTWGNPANRFPDCAFIQGVI